MGDSTQSTRSAIIKEAAPTLQSSGIDVWVEAKKVGVSCLNFISDVASSAHRLANKIEALCEEASTFFADVFGSQAYLTARDLVLGRPEWSLGSPAFQNFVISVLDYGFELKAVLESLFEDKGDGFLGSLIQAEASSSAFLSETFSLIFSDYVEAVLAPALDVVDYSSDVTLHRSGLDLSGSAAKGVVNTSTTTFVTDKTLAGISFVQPANAGAASSVSNKAATLKTHFFVGDMGSGVWELRQLWLANPLNAAQLTEIETAMGGLSQTNNRAKSKFDHMINLYLFMTEPVELDLTWIDAYFYGNFGEYVEDILTIMTPDKFPGLGESFDLLRGGVFVAAQASSPTSED